MARAFGLALTAWRFLTIIEASKHEVAMARIFADAPKAHPFRQEYPWAEMKVLDQAWFDLTYWDPAVVRGSCYQVGKTKKAKDFKFRTETKGNYLVVWRIK